jgi:hypothetical protein
MIPKQSDPKYIMGPLYGIQKSETTVKYSWLAYTWLARICPTCGGSSTVQSESEQNWQRYALPGFLVVVIRSYGVILGIY